MRFQAPIRASVKLSGLHSSKGGFEILSDVERHIDLPDRFGPAELERCRNDCELLSHKLGADPALAIRLLQALRHPDPAQARAIAQQLGIVEERFQAEGGGLMWLVVVVVLLYASDAY